MPINVSEVKNNYRSLTVWEGVTQTSEVTSLLARGLPHLSPRKANQCISDAMRVNPVAPLFDEFWREGELALLFGAHATGKSVLAVQIADALARGTPLVGFRMSKARHKVLFVDLDCSDAQFHARYAPHKFPERLYRDRPPSNVDLCEWLRATVKENGFRVVIIDSLLAIKRTHDGIRETLAAMRRLKQIRDELGISILAVTDAFEPVGTWLVSEVDMKRSRVLCTVADSVFAMGRKGRPEGGRYLVQVRSRNAAAVWDHRNAPVGTITRLESGLLGFEFDERFAPQLDEETRRLLVKMNILRSRGESFRSIATTLGIPKTKAHSLWKKWNPLIDSLTEELEPRINTEEQGSEEGEEWDEAGYERPVWLEDEGGSTGAQASRLHERSEQFLPANYANEHELFLDPTAIPFAAGLARRSIYDLDLGFDSYGNQIFVETRDEHTGKPRLWYQFDAKGNKLRHERGAFGITVEHMYPGPFL